MRRLKSTDHKENLIEVRKNQEEIKNIKHITNKQIYININNQENIPKNLSIILKPIMTEKNSLKINNNNNDNIINLSNNNLNFDQRRINQSNILLSRKSLNISKNILNKRISIDSLAKHSSISINNKSQNKTFDYETLKKYKKRKLSEYQKNLLS